MLMILGNEGGVGKGCIYLMGGVVMLREHVLSFSLSIFG